MNNKAFTLIEILVAVLIIGILAAIVVPKYQIAVGRAKFSTVKNLVKSIAEAEEAYYLANGKYAKSLYSLDIGVPNNVTCHIWAKEDEDSQKAVACDVYIKNIRMAYYQFFLGDKQYAGKGRCFVESPDKTDIPNRICQQGKTSVTCDSKYCSYYY